LLLHGKMRRDAAIYFLARHRCGPAGDALVEIVVPKLVTALP
jgi:hypothetical protein